MAERVGLGAAVKKGRRVANSVPLRSAARALQPVPTRLFLSSLSKRVNPSESQADAPFHRMRSAAPGWRRWSWRRPAKPGPGVKAPSMGAFHRPSGFHGRPRRRRPPSGSPSKCSALALHLHGKPPARCRRRPGRTASVWQCAACAERGTSTRPCRLASAGAALRPPPCSDHRAGSYLPRNPCFRLVFK